MTLLVLGVSHHSAPLSVLDEMALAPDEVDRLAADLTADDSVSEVLVLATCNRVEVYADVTRFHAAMAAISEHLAKSTGLDRDTLAEHSYVHFDTAAVAHMFTVASGLDSMVVGEAQIIGQVRSSLARGQELGTAGRELNNVVQTALRVGKRVHTETGIDRSGVSVVSVALDAAAEVVGALASARVLVVGAGSMGSLAVATLASLGAGGCGAAGEAAVADGRSGVADRAGVVVANRTAEAGARLAASVPGGRAVGLSDIPVELACADVAIFCTGALGTIVDRELMLAVRSNRPAGREQAPQVLLDLAVPHDTTADVGSVPGVVRLDLAALGELPAAAASQADVQAARQIVADEVRAHMAAAAAQAVEPTLISLRAHAGGVLEAEMARLRLRLANVDDATLAEVERAMRRAVATLLHNPTVRMKQLAAEPGGDRYAEALSALFGLDPSIPTAVLDASDRRDRGGAA